MTEFEETSSKRRKLNSSEDPTENNHETPLIPLADENRTEEEQQGSEKEGDHVSRINLNDPAAGSAPLSKSQLKKRRRQEQWEAAKDLRKDKRRDKRHEKQTRKAQEKAELHDKIAKGEIEAPEISPEESKRRHLRPVQVPVTLLIDCDFNEFMTEKELISMGAQLTRSYSDNRHSKHRAHIAISSWKGALRTRFETVLTNHHKSWKGVRFIEEDFVEAGKRMDVIMRGQDGGKLAGALASCEGKTVHLNENESRKENGNEALPGRDDSPAGKTSTLEEDHAESVVENRALNPPTKRKAEANAQSQNNIEIESHPDPSGPALSSAPQLEALTSVPTTNAEDVAASPSSATDLPPTSEASLVYLTSDSPHTLERLSPYTSYVIGGIVDKNRHKGLCYKRACERGIPTAKLPIGEYMTMQSRTVLATNHVVEIMLKWLDTGDWGEAFLSVIPKRKEAKLREKESAGENAGEDEERIDEE